MTACLAVASIRTICVLRFILQGGLLLLWSTIFVVSLVAIEITTLDPVFVPRLLHRLLLRLTRWLMHLGVHKNIALPFIQRCVERLVDYFGLDDLWLVQILSVNGLAFPKIVNNFFGRRHFDALSRRETSQHGQIRVGCQIVILACADLSLMILSVIICPF